MKPPVTNINLSPKGLLKLFKFCTQIHPLSGYKPIPQVLPTNLTNIASNACDVNAIVAIIIDSTDKNNIKYEIILSILLSINMLNKLIYSIFF